MSVFEPVTLWAPQSGRHAGGRTGLPWHLNRGRIHLSQRETMKTRFATYSEHRLVPSELLQLSESAVLLRLSIRLRPAELKAEIRQLAEELGLKARAIFPLLAVGRSSGCACGPESGRVTGETILCMVLLKRELCMHRSSQFRRCALSSSRHQTDKGLDVVMATDCF